MSEKFYGRIGYDNEGIVREHEFKTLAEAEAYKLGALDMQEQCNISIDILDENPLDNYWATASNLESIDG